ncbi:MAG: hypothetical protein U5K30_04320 [Acidimicrobiales bacterium]|nr:hypothetical protein [Acidimicrobiales bacterium]
MKKSKVPESEPGPNRVRVLVGEVEPIDVAPTVHGRALVPDLVELVRGDALEGVVGVHDGGQGVVGDLDALEGDAVALADLDLLVVDRAGGAVAVGLAGAELLEAAAGAGDGHRHLDAGVLLHEQLGRDLGQGADGAGAVEVHRAAQVTAAAIVAGRVVGGVGRLFVRGALVVAAGGGDERQGQEQGDQRRPTSVPEQCLSSVQGIRGCLFRHAHGKDRRWRASPTRVNDR